MTSNIYIYISLISFIFFFSGCSNSLTTRGEQQTVQTIDDAFPDVDDISQTELEDLSDEDFDNFDEESEDQAVASDDTSDIEINDNEFDNFEADEFENEDVAAGTEVTDDDFDDFSDEELDGLDTSEAPQVAQNDFDLDDDSLDLGGSSNENLEDDDFSDFDEPQDNLVTNDAGKNAEDPFADFLTDDLDDNFSLEDEDLSDESFADTEEESVDQDLALDSSDELDLGEGELDGLEAELDDSSLANDLPDKGGSPESDSFEDSFGDDLLADQAQEDVLPKDNLEQDLDTIFEETIEAPISDDLIVSDIGGDSGSNKLMVLEYNAQAANGAIVLKAEKPIEFSTQYDPANSQYIVNLQKVVVPSILQRPLYLKDFKQSFGAVKATPVSDGLVQLVIKVNNGQEPNLISNGKEIVITPGTDGMFGKVAKVSANESLTNGENLSEKMGDGLTLTSNSVEAEEANSSSLEDFLLETGKFYGDPISLQVYDEEIATVIGFIADYSGANIVISPGISGKITIKLRNVPWDQALLTIMKTKGLGYVRTGNVLRIASLDDLKKEAQAALDVKNSQQLIEPTTLKVIPLEYADSAAVVTQVTPFITKDRGSVTEDKRTSSIIINDTRAVISKVSKLIKELDLAPPQVLIEAKIVEASKTFSQNLGIRWGVGGTTSQLAATGGANNGPITISPSLRINDTNTVANPTLFGSINVGVLDFLGNIDAAIGLSESDEQVKVISSPRITTLNNEEATILQTSEILRSMQTNTQGTVTTTIQAVPLTLQLKVKPQITSGASVIMNINVQNEFPGAPNPQGQPPKNSRQATAKVLVDSGKTAVIGGIYDKNDSIINTGVPLLKDIPVLGWLFKNKGVSKKNNEIMIFITPRILDKNYQTSADSNIY